MVKIAIWEVIGIALAVYAYVKNKDGKNYSYQLLVLTGWLFVLLGSICRVILDALQKLAK